MSNDKNEKGGVVDDHESDAGTEHLILSADEERRLKRRIDWSIIPYCTLLFLLSFLDRVNIGQAKTANLEKDLHLTDRQYAIALTVLFVSYVSVEVPSNLLLRRFKPHRVIAISMLLWGLLTTLLGIVTDYKGLVTVRFLLGVAEGGLFPGINLILTHWYTRDESNFMVAIFFAGSTLAGAWGGLLAYGIRHMAGVGGRDGWAWIFILEGILTIVVALPAWWVVPDFPEDAKFLAPREKDLWIARVKRSQGLTGTPIPFRWRFVTRAFADWRTYAYALLYISTGVPFYSLSLFTPTIITGLGFSNANANLLSVPPYAVGFVVTLLVAHASDRTKLRGPFIVPFLILVIIGYAILIAPVSVGVRYFALHLAVTGVSPAVATAITWVGHNFGPTWTRASVMGFFFMVGNSGGIISSNVYPAKQAPRFVEGNAISIAFAGLGIVCAVALMAYYRVENARRDREYGVVTVGKVAMADGAPVDFLDRKRWKLEGLSDLEITELGDRHPAYRYMI